MRDIVIIFPEDKNDTSWNLDIDIVDGQPRLVQEENNSQDQRAALAALMSKGTIPGAREVGVSWNDLLSNKGSLLSIDNEVKRQIAALAAIGNDEQLFQYLPIYKSDGKGGVDVAVYRVV